MLNLGLQLESSFMLYVSRLFTVPSLSNVEVHTYYFPGTRGKLRQRVATFVTGALKTKNKRNREERREPSPFSLGFLLVYPHTKFSTCALPTGLEYTLSLSLSVRIKICMFRCPIHVRPGTMRYFYIASLLYRPLGKFP